MAEQPKPPLKRPRGAIVRWSDADLDRLSRTTPDDVAHAAQAWRDSAPPALRTLLDATEEDLI
jgi:hypothetical protein